MDWNAIVCAPCSAAAPDKPAALGTVARDSPTEPGMLPTPGNSTTFTLRFNGSVAATYSGEVKIDHNETPGAQFKFTVNATALGSGIFVNFQPAAAEVPTGYLLDAGQVFGNRGNGYSYGFNQTITSATRDRDIPHLAHRAGAT